MRWFRFAVLACMVVAVSGCSVGAPQAPKGARTSATPPATPTASPTPEPKYLEVSDINKTPADSPERSLTEFWWAIQYRDIPGAYDLIASDFRRQFARSLPHFTEFVMADWGRWLNRPRVLMRLNRGTSSVLTVTYARPEQKVPDRFAVTFVREDGTWKLAYDFYLANRLQGN